MRRREWIYATDAQKRYQLIRIPASDADGKRLDGRTAWKLAVEKFGFEITLARGKAKRRTEIRSLTRLCYSSYDSSCESYDE